MIIFAIGERSRLGCVLRDLAAFESGFEHENYKDNNGR